MRAATGRVDVIGEAVQAFGVAIVILHGHLNRHRVFLALFRPFEINHLAVNDILAFVELFYELDNSLGVFEFILFAAAFIFQIKREAFIEISQFAAACHNAVVIKNNLRKNLRVRLKGYFRS